MREKQPINSDKYGKRGKNYGSIIISSFGMKNRLLIQNQLDQLEAINKKSQISVKSHTKYKRITNIAVKGRKSFQATCSLM